MFLKRNNFSTKMFLEIYNFAAPLPLHCLLYLKNIIIPGSKQMKPGMKRGVINKNRPQ